MTALRLAVRLAFSADRRARWRQASAVGAAFLATLLALLALGVIHAAQGADAVRDARAPTWSTSDVDVALLVSLSGMRLDGVQTSVVWLEPGSTANDPAAIPPGLDHLPEPGSAVLSPGLHEAGYTASDFGLAQSHAGSGPDGAIGVDGVISASDYWIYARAPQGRSLNSDGTALPFAGYGLPGEQASFEADPGVSSAGEATLGSLWLLIAPGLVLLIGGARAVSSIRLDRARVLRRFGVATRRVWAVMWLESGLLALVGALPAAATWALWGSHLTRLPLTGTELHPEALQAGPVAVIAAVVAVVAIAGTAGAWVRGGSASTVKRRRLDPRGLVPFLIALAMMVGAPAFPHGSTGRPVLLFGGLTLMFAALPFAMPVLTARVGSVLSRAGAAPAAWLAGRRLSAGAWNLARPATVTGLLVFIAGSSFALYADMVTPEAEQSIEREYSLYSLYWRDPQPGDARRAADRLPSADVVPVYEGPDGRSHITVGACEELETMADALGTTACGDDGAITEALREAVATSTSGAFSLAAPDPRQERQEPHGLLVVGAGPAASDPLTQRELMAATADVLPAVNISAWAYDSTPPPSLGWIVAGWAAASITLLLALIREIADRAVGAIQSDDNLRRLGFSSREASAIHRWTLFAPLAIAIPIGYAGAVAFAVIGYQLGYVTQSLAAITIVALATAALAIVTTYAAFTMTSSPRTRG